MSSLKNWFENAAKIGMYLPMAFDGRSGKPSITLLIFYFGMVLTVLSLILLHVNARFLSATIATLFFLILGFVFYRLRNLDKVKIDLSKQSIELDGDEENDDVAK